MKGPQTVTPTESGTSTNEIRVVQSMQSLVNLPALVGGQAVSAGIVASLDWSATVSSYAIFPIVLSLLLLTLPTRSWFRLRHKTPPKKVSKRRIQSLENFTWLMGGVWVGIVLLIMTKLTPADNAFVMATIFCLCFAAVGLNPSLPRAAAVYCGAVLLALLVGALINDVIRPDILVISVVAIGLILTRMIWQNWQYTKQSVKLSKEMLQAETEMRERETGAMRAMLEAIPFPLVLARAEGVLEVSETAARQFGIPAKSVNGPVLDDLLVDPEDLVAITKSQTEQGYLEGYELQLARADGAPFWALLSSLPLTYEGEDCWLYAFYVIDDRKRAEADLIKAHAALERVSTQLAKYISPQLYQAIFSGEQKVAIESKRKKLTVFFSDIVDFTEITDQLESEQLTELLNEYLTEMSIVAHRYGAYFDKFIGDAMMFYFGDPETKGVQEDASACVHMAIAMQNRLRELQTKWREQGLIDRPFETRVGINTGYCTVGNFGSEDRMDYTIIGREVNLASRLQSNADAGGILMSAETYAQVKKWVLAEERNAITLKGFPKPIPTFAATGIYDDLVAESRIIRHEECGLSITIDTEKMDKTSSVMALKKILADVDQ